MSLFDHCIDYSEEVYRNIRGIKVSQHLFDDLSDDPSNWDAANTLDIHTHPPLEQAQLIQRGFDYSKNDFIEYPFEHITRSRYSDGSIACWYGSESLETTIYETRYHFIKEILDAPDAFQGESVVTIDRRVARVHCAALALDVSHKTHDFPWLIDPNDYSKCQEIGRRVASEGHPLLRAPSARHLQGINLVVFSNKALSNPYEHCQLQYQFNMQKQEVKIFRGLTQLEP